MQRDHVRQRYRWYGTAFSPLSLFFGGANGAWYDPSDFSTMFQDAAGTTPVTAVGQPVGRILDNSGRGNHAYNPSGNSANFPVLQQDGAGRYYLLFNGINQWLQSIGSINFTASAQMLVSAGIRKLSDASAGALAELSANWGTSNGTFAVFAPGGSVLNGIGFRSSGTSGQQSDVQPFASPISLVVSQRSSISDPLLEGRINGITRTSTASTQGTGTYGNYPLYIGARAGTSLFFNGRLYGLVVAGKAASAGEVASTESWLNQKTGAY